ncbi:MAG: FecR family protein [Odoribacter splanchnicus]
MKQKFTNRELFWLWIAKNRMQSSQYDSIRGWQRFNEKNYSKRRRIFMTTGAAVVALLLGVGGMLVWNSLRQPTVTPVVQKIVRAAGVPVLTLANGKMISLVDSITHPIRESDADVVVGDSSSLTYVVDKKQKTAGKEVYNTLYIPKGGEYSLVLADGTCVWLNSETTLRYPVNFIGMQRVVQLEGEAYFEVAPDSLRPFYIQMNGNVIKVLGTSFNVSNYTADGSWSTTLTEGKVEICSGGNLYTLTPGDHFTADVTTGETRIVRVNPLQYSSWKEGKVIFQDERLEDIIRKLARWYDFEVFYIHSELKDWHFGGTINKYNPFDVVLRYLERTANIRFDIQGKTVMVSRLD